MRLRKMDKYQIYTAIENMDRFGGSFEQALAFCYSQADPDNKTILLSAFEPLFIKFIDFRNEE